MSGKNQLKQLLKFLVSCVFVGCQVGWLGWAIMLLDGKFFLEESGIDFGGMVSRRMHYKLFVHLDD